MKKTKYFIGYLYNGNIVKPLNMLPKKSAYVKSYDGCIFLIENDKLLVKYNNIWDKVNTEFDSEPVYNKNYLKPKYNLMVMKLQIFVIKKFLS